jgi:hypothetical protein
MLFSSGVLLLSNARELAFISCFENHIIAFCLYMYSCNCSYLDWAILLSSQYAVHLGSVIGTTSMIFYWDITRICSSHMSLNLSLPYFLFFCKHESVASRFRVFPP